MRNGSHKSFLGMTIPCLQLIDWNLNLGDLLFDNEQILFHILCHFKERKYIALLYLSLNFVSILVFRKHLVNRSAFFANLRHYPNICISVNKSDRKAYSVPF